LFQSVKVTNTHGKQKCESENQKNQKYDCKLKSSTNYLLKFTLDEGKTLCWFCSLHSIWHMEGAYYQLLNTLMKLNLKLICENKAEGHVENCAEKVELCCLPTCTLHSDSKVATKRSQWNVLLVSGPEEPLLALTPSSSDLQLRKHLTWGRIVAWLQFQEGYLTRSGAPAQGSPDT
jgi:hypothetical protein